ncbi:MAG: hypothetical protein JWO47_295 [Candidatus Saccharibacteria bacterium]|nr:hypothetical protein [Candidatus Saccharibacteria bacterium]
MNNLPKTPDTQPDIMDIAAPLAAQLVNESLPKHIDEVIAEIDEKFPQEEGPSLAQLWKYREEVRAKYGLPECGGRWRDPQAYINTMEDFLGREHIDIRAKYEFEPFFNEYPTAGAVTFESSAFRDVTIVASVSSSNNFYGLRKRANYLAHEAVHGMQQKRSPRMPNEIGEREAYYYQMLTPQRIRETDDIFTFIATVIEPYIVGSVELNERMNEKR